MTTNNAGWSRGWSYLRNDGERLPAYTEKVLRGKRNEWRYGVSPPKCQTKLRVFFEALKLLVNKGLTAAAVIANFHRQRVLPLMERKLAIYQLTPKATPEGSRMSKRLLSHDAAALRAKSAAAHFPSDVTQLWMIKMRPEEEYI
jgi:hypothetical protein